jgi:hypothetical protein
MESNRIMETSATLAAQRIGERVVRSELWWKGHSPRAVAIVVLLIFLSIFPSMAGYLLEPSGMHFTGAATYTEDQAQHEAWATEMAAHIWYQNLLTPEQVSRGWFITPLELFLGLIQRTTGIPYDFAGDALCLACAPLLAFALMTLARRAGISRPGIAAITSVLACSFAPLLRAAAIIGLFRQSLPTMLSVGGAATPIFAGPSPYLLLAVLTLIALPSNTQNPGSGFRRAAIALCPLAAIYPFFIPTLWLTAGFSALLWSATYGWKRILRGLSWLVFFSGISMSYWAVLPLIDTEYARFAHSNWVPLLSLPCALVSIGLGLGAIIGLPRLLRGNNYQQMLASFTLAFITALYVPAHPWRSHIFNLSPVLIIATFAAWSPVLLQLGRRHWIVAGSFLVAVTLNNLYYYARNVRGLLNFGPPTYLTTGDLAAIQWISSRPGIDVVLARSDLSPWVASRGHHRVIVGHYLWTHEYRRRRAEVDAIFDIGANPQPLIRKDHVRWVLIDGDRGVPIWARGIRPAVRFDRTIILSADDLFVRSE